MSNLRNNLARVLTQFNDNIQPLFTQRSQTPRLGARRRTLRRLVSTCSIGVVSLAGMARAQDAHAQATSAPVAYASVSELNGILSHLKESSTAMQADLAKTRVEHWKTDGSTKRQTQGNVESIQRNLQSALPEIVAQVGNSPEDLAATFKLYRNLDALYDVFGSVVESAGAFGSKDEFQSLSTDMGGLENARRAMGERMQKLAGAKEEELAQLRTQVKTLTAAPPPPPKKIIVDDTELAPKKPAPKKKTTKPTTAKPSTQTTPPASPSGTQNK
ncbi:MAG: hypothetical protein WAL71_04105 [Terriglobales bacterium]